MDPVHRTSSPYVDPSVKGPQSKILSRNPPNLQEKSESLSLGLPSHLLLLLLVVVFFSIEVFFLTDLLSQQW